MADIQNIQEAWEGHSGSEVEKFIKGSLEEKVSAILVNNTEVEKDKDGNVNIPVPTVDENLPGSKLVDGSIPGSKLAEGAVTTEKLAEGTIDALRMDVYPEIVRIEQETKARQDEIEADCAAKKAQVDASIADVDERIALNRAEINAAQLEIGAVQTDEKPTQGSANHLTSGAVYNAFQENTGILHYGNMMCTVKNERSYAVHIDKGKQIIVKVSLAGAKVKLMLRYSDNWADRATYTYTEDGVYDIITPTDDSIEYVAATWTGYSSDSAIVIYDGNTLQKQLTEEIEQAVETRSRNYLFPYIHKFNKTEEVFDYTLSIADMLMFDVEINGNSTVTIDFKASNGAYYDTTVLQDSGMFYYSCNGKEITAIRVKINGSALITMSKQGENMPIKLDECFSDYAKRHNYLYKIYGNFNNLQYLSDNDNAFYINVVLGKAQSVEFSIKNGSGVTKTKTITSDGLVYCYLLNVRWFSAVYTGDASESYIELYKYSELEAPITNNTIALNSNKVDYMYNNRIIAYQSNSYNMDIPLSSRLLITCNIEDASSMRLEGRYMSKTSHKYSYDVLKEWNISTSDDVVQLPYNNKYDGVRVTITLPNSGGFNNYMSITLYDNVVKRIESNANDIQTLLSYDNYGRDICMRNLCNFTTILKKIVDSNKTSLQTQATLKRISKTAYVYAHVPKMFIYNGNAYVSMLQNTNSSGESSSSQTRENVVNTFSLARYESDDWNVDNDIVSIVVNKTGKTYKDSEGNTFTDYNAPGGLGMCRVDGILHIVSEHRTNSSDKNYIQILHQTVNLSNNSLSEYTDKCYLVYNGISYLFDISNVKKIYSELGICEKETSVNIVSDFVKYGEFWYNTVIGEDGPSYGMLIRTTDFITYEYVDYLPFNKWGGDEAMLALKGHELYIACRQTYGVPFMLYAKYNLQYGYWMKYSKVPTSNSRPYMWLFGNKMYTLYPTTDARDVWQLAREADTNYGDNIHFEDLATLNFRGDYPCVYVDGNIWYYAVAINQRTQVVFGKLVYSSSNADGLVTKLITLLKE